MIGALQRALQLLLSSGEVIRTDWAPHPGQAQVHGVSGEVLDRVPILSPWGIAARPPGGSRVLMGALGADRTRLVVLSAAHEDDRPPALGEGEVALYARGGAVLHLLADGTIRIEGDVAIQGNLVASGSILAAGDVADATGSLALLRAQFQSHRHQETGSTTGPPQ